MKIPTSLKVTAYLSACLMFVCECVCYTVYCEFHQIQSSFGDVVKDPHVLVSARNILSTSIKQLDLVLVAKGVTLTDEIYLPLHDLTEIEINLV
jgi:hypothetical protein